MEHENQKSSSSSLHAHGDGTYHVMHGGEWGGKRTEHKSIGSALMHMAKMHAEDDHMHIEGHEDGFTTHHVMAGGKVTGPHEHKTLGAVKKHITATMDADDEV